MKALGKRGLVLLTALAVTGLVGCGGDEDTTGAFVGAWRYTSGTSTTNCGGTSNTDQVSGTVNIMKGVAAPLVSVDDSCTIAMDVNGSTATARIPQECSQVIDGNTATMKLTAYTFTVNGLVATESGSATLQIAFPTGNVNCNYTQSAMLMKVSQ